MRNYEILFILRPDLTEEEVEASREKVKSIISDNGGEVTKLDPMGKRRLAYEIQDYREGIYTVIYFTGDDKTVKELDRVVRITEDIIRYLIVKND
ncbi:MAG: 30S ribosomal protein S6 [Thermicanus sp.]|nr:30S ribosomal protein S6 [Thermicanus sp.]